MNGDTERDEVVADALARLATPPPPPDFFGRFWARVDAEHRDAVAQGVAATGSDSMPRREAEGPSPGLATAARLDQVRMTAEAIVLASGGSQAEADEVAEEVMAHVDYNWQTLRLDVLIGDPAAWERHLVRETLRRWLAHLYGVRRPRSGPSSESTARARVLGLADAADLDPEDCDLFDNIYVYGFSVAETAFMFGLEQVELLRRLRRIWGAVRRHAYSVHF